MRTECQSQSRRGWAGGKAQPAGIVILVVAAAAELVLAFTSCRRQQGRNAAPARGAVFVLKRGF
ncbi:hypothetical protein [Nitrososphaera sp.]|uniref:hypothetical protein n=1 Tax=Nitrososphaera sp. TaxID=1971748 RepID=UPI00307ED3F4